MPISNEILWQKAFASYPVKFASLVFLWKNLTGKSWCKTTLLRSIELRRGVQLMVPERKMGAKRLRRG
jgi:hypothetical protein